MATTTKFVKSNWQNGNNVTKERRWHVLFPPMVSCKTNNDSKNGNMAAIINRINKCKAAVTCMLLLQIMAGSIRMLSIGGVVSPYIWCHLVWQCCITTMFTANKLRTLSPISIMHNFGLLPFHFAFSGTRQISQLKRNKGFTVASKGTFCEYSHCKYSAEIWLYMSRTTNKTPSLVERFEC